MIDRSAMMELPRPAPVERAPREARSNAGFDRLLGAEVTEAKAEAETVVPRQGNALEVAFADLEGGGQSILLPWRLFANDELSQLLQGTSGSDPGVSKPGETGSAALMATSIGASGAGVPTMPTVTGPSARDGFSVPLAAAANMSAIDVARAPERAPAATLQVLADPWQARLLRWLEGSDGRLVARLRDYRLDPTTEARCVEQLLAFARENGLQLQRVVVNAREVWRAPR